VAHHQGSQAATAGRRSLIVGSVLALIALELERQRSRGHQLLYSAVISKVQPRRALCRAIFDFPP
jgi:hypothetical protein